MSERSPGMWSNQRVAHKTTSKKSNQIPSIVKMSKATVEEVNRVLEVGRLLFSVLTPKEIDELCQLLNSGKEE